MCIRDRDTPAPADTPATNSAAPVSYTHLDVYKRQGVHRHFAAGQAERIGLIRLQDRHRPIEGIFDMAGLQTMLGRQTVGHLRDFLDQALSNCLLYTSRCV